MSVEVVLDVEPVWNDVVKYIDSTIPYVHDEFSTAEIKDKLLCGEYNLLVIKNNTNIIGVIVFNTQIVAGKKTAFIVVTAGRHITTPTIWSELKMLLNNLGYVYIEAAMRDSTLRLWSKLGFEKKYNMAGVNI